MPSEPRWAVHSPPTERSDKDDPNICRICRIDDRVDEESFTLRNPPSTKVTPDELATGRDRGCYNCQVILEGLAALYGDDGIKRSYVISLVNSLKSPHPLELELTEKTLDGQEIYPVEYYTSEGEIDISC